MSTEKRICAKPMLTGSKHYGGHFKYSSWRHTEFNVMVTSLVGYVIKDCGSYILCWFFYFKPGVRDLVHESPLQALPNELYNTD